MQINKTVNLTWKGKFCAPISNQGIYPRTLQEQLPIWIGVGGTPKSAIRAGRLGLTLMIAILGSAPKHFVPFVELYRETSEKAGHDVAKLQVDISSQFLAGDTNEEARDAFCPS
ncbi:LLM class flavin-dependent oxidoreductase [Mucilaginibacter sp. RB4R14]|uniref:LLM class flavin-dependent oxidoreductase n=1 Tax=Mucilaginibacter aurantiaciroseus TaxID=2949308 RepID=UPI002090D0B9|nr:LLM class flavin-dependent oxidoreductase [Mucilaginibacter aurantiaciroseus]MCO5936373.1 LLM class flavin-dependent oxidoreductase [Mucilaginibacter aurantiaciroseus]